ncbi:hypothetical protein J0X19_06540 [Hymenobacter sp. BT186]|uniref:Uncharacterized protein n=1 Tax=Hymenobacter telluris TaxID=2816474 RepID=A0A939JCS3_9BACT|nr:hypothetical protein [Hymenobacter telluris]MBO0357597.1 hypothetical protein [Hymenobacter telluris]MBW3373623.1 hypothetical protein [Hymenobacter norwichensis]
MKRPFWKQGGRFLYALSTVNNTARLLVITLLYAVFAAVYLRVAFPEPPEPKIERRWAAPRLLVSDSVLYGFVQELLAQSSSDPSPKGMVHADFYISQVLFEHAPIPSPGKHVFQYAVQEDNWSLKELCNRYHLLAPIDTAFMRQQMTYSTGFGLEQRFLPNYKIIPVDTVWALVSRLGHNLNHMQVLRGRYNTTSFSWLSSPLFSHDKQKVIVEINETCGGGLCGSGQTWLLQRRQGRWHKVRLLSEWIS